MIPGMFAAAPAAVRFLVVALAFFAEPDAKFHELTGKVVHIADGDTLTVLDADKVQHKIRLHGIDAPEKGAGVRDQGEGSPRREGPREDRPRRLEREGPLRPDRRRRSPRATGTSTSKWFTTASRGGIDTTPRSRRRWKQAEAEARKETTRALARQESRAAVGIQKEGTRSREVV